MGVAVDLRRGLCVTSSASLGEFPKTADVAADVVWEKGNADSRREANGVSFSESRLVDVTSDN